MPPSNLITYSNDSLQFILPDLLGPCPYELGVSPHSGAAGQATKLWLLQGAPHYQKAVKKYDALNPGLLAAMGYPTASSEQLRLCNDWLVWLFAYDDLTDGFNERDAAAMGEDVMQGLRGPAYECTSLVGKLAKE